MVFGIDDLIEGATLSEIIFFIASSIFSEASIITAGESATTAGAGEVSRASIAVAKLRGCGTFMLDGLEPVADDI